MTDLPDTEPEPIPTWYWRSSGFFGRRGVHLGASIGYSVLALLPLGWYAVTEQPPTGLPLWLGVLWGCIVALGYPAWSWLETRQFEKWVRSQPKVVRDRERYYYKLMMDHSKSFWTAVLAIYTVAALLNAVWKKS